MAARYTTPHYVTLGLILTLRAPDGEMHNIPVIVAEVGEDGIEVLIAKMLEACAVRGLVPPTDAEFDAWARERVQERMQEYAMRMFEEHTVQQGTTEHDELLARHMSKNPKGDA